jgi:hypothetical protein
MTIDTLIRLDRFGRVVAFAVKTVGKGKNITGAILNTVTTPFTPIINDMNSSLGNLNNIRVKRNTPEFHSLVLYPGSINYNTAKHQDISKSSMMPPE